MTDNVYQTVRERVQEAHARLDKLTERVGKVETNSAVLEQRLQGIQESLQKIDNNLSKIFWLFVAGIIAAIVTFIVRGGLVNGL
ncbi:hemolysin XhlA family protein [Martelella lutilitoris]|uniref:Hemolysin XhlA family protein n=1 Tax=Martelella lutilitoris TaxID=2583532 RepID=A0A7T7KJY7_9HYPH|nr:hemolysin XhlA family protein [Martelella lutilitoris]QQM29061.1 hemolysin XhlA family protein [Martelella lutilitoris]